jgi:hypothetical protein
MYRGFWWGNKGEGNFEYLTVDWMMMKMMVIIIIIIIICKKWDGRSLT